MEFASFRQFLNASGEKKIENRQMIKHDDLCLEQKLRHDRIFFRRRRIKIARSAQIPFIIYNLSFIIYNLKREPCQIK